MVPKRAFGLRIRAPNTVFHVLASFLRNRADRRFLNRPHLGLGLGKRVSAYFVPYNAANPDLPLRSHEISSGDGLQFCPIQISLSDSAGFQPQAMIQKPSLRAVGLCLIVHDGSQGMPTRPDCIFMHAANYGQVLVGHQPPIGIRFKQSFPKVAENSV
jgi:hypothetical protein